MTFAPFVPLRIFSGFTMLEGAIEPKDIAKHVAKLNYPAAAITDRNGLYGAMAFAEACFANGVQPIIGCMLAVARPRPEGAPLEIDWLALYAQDEQGYQNLCVLTSAAHLDRPDHEEAHVDFTKLAQHSAGLIALTAGAEGALVRLLAGQQDRDAEAYLNRLQTLFADHLYIEISRRRDDTERAAEARLIALADAQNVPLVATNPAFYAEADFHPAHDALRCISDSAYIESEVRARSSPEAWLKPAEDMAKRFADLPDALANTLVVAQRCAAKAPYRKPILPSLAGDIVGETMQLMLDAKNGLEERLKGVPDADREGYHARLTFELDVIVKMGFPGYFLIVADFIKWAKGQGIPVGPGRGSGAGSVVAWALTITDLDPIKLGLLFERFLNPERVSMPDFDIDFCETRREEVIRYVQQKYGRDHVAQIITFGRLKSRAVLKDVGRVLQMSYGQVDRLAKLIPNLPADPWTLERALNGVSELAAEYKKDEQVRRLFDLAKRLEGLPRHSSTHAAGVVIGDWPLAQLVPLYRDPRSDMPVTQFDMKYAEAAGLVKFDFLGLKTLSVIHEALRLIETRTGERVAIDRLAWEDEKVYALLQKGDTVGVFQLESEGMRRALSSVRPSCFEDIIAIGALCRPGPMDNIPMFGARKNGREPIAYPHPLLEPILKETYGIIVYQEQVMQAAQILAGYSLGEADLLRRAMGKKIQSEMDAQRARFVEGCKANEIAADHANELFDLIDKFAGYGFNKSHAAAYALLSYQTAWLKAHYPHEFYAASMSFEIGQTDKLNVFVDDLRRMGYMCLPPCINQSAASFTVEENGEGLAVRYALGALKNVGEAAMASLCVEREVQGAFTSIENFAQRIEGRLLNRRQMESLAAAGAFDGLKLERAAVHGGVEALLAAIAYAENARTSGQGGLFGDDGSDMEAIPLSPHIWTMRERATFEREAFGFYFSAHPVDRYKHVAQAHGARNYESVCAMPLSASGRTGATMAALMEEVRWRTSARGRRYMLVKCSDASGQYEASCFDDDIMAMLEEFGKASACVLLTVEMDKKAVDEAPRIAIRRAQRLDTLTEQARLRCEVMVADTPDSGDALVTLATLLADRRGQRGELFLVLNPQTQQGGQSVRLLLGRDYSIDSETVEKIENIIGVTSVTLMPMGGSSLRMVG